MISVVIPAYNRATTLAKCLNSVFGQTYTGKVEVIVVDDASTDNTAAVAQRYPVRYHRNTHNLGHYRSRLVGVDLAQGSRVLFLDSDDWLPRNAIALLAAHDVDIVCGDYVYRLTRFNIPHHFNRYELGGTISKEQINHTYIRSAFGDHTLLPVSVCAKLYKTDLLRSITFPQYASFWGEDRVMLFHALHQAQSIECIPNTVYNYRWGGGTRSFSPDALRQYSQWHEQMCTFAHTYGYEQHIPVADAELRSISDYFVRNAIIAGFPEEETLRLLMAHLGISHQDAQQRYNAQQRAVKGSRFRSLLKRWL